MFGYQDLVVDYRNIPVINDFALSVMDCTHSCQIPNSLSGSAQGNPRWMDLYLSSALVAGAQGLFVETHPNPAEALSDGTNLLHLRDLDNFVFRAQKISLNTKDLYV